MFLLGWYLDAEWGVGDDKNLQLYKTIFSFLSDNEVSTATVEVIVQNKAALALQREVQGDESESQLIEKYRTVQQTTHQ